MNNRKEKIAREVEKTMGLLDEPSRMKAPTDFVDMVMPMIVAEKSNSQRSIRREILKIVAILIFVVANATLLFSETNTSEESTSNPSSAETLITEYGLEQQSYQW